ncbi:MAG: SagB-type dehydrogenase domain protein, partial [Firmicutes bacterium]|nr:SagB-type dehydrogenase domain protein [Bacillota bacterium]
MLHPGVTEGKGEVQVDYPFIMCLWDDVTVADKPDGAIELQGPGTSWTLNKPTDGLREVIAALTGGVDEDTLVGLAVGQGGDLPSFYYLLEKLRGLQFLCYGVKQGGGWLAKCQPRTADFVFDRERVECGRQYVLSRFASSRQEAGRAILESPLACCRLVLCDWLAAAVVHMLS